MEEILKKNIFDDKALLKLSPDYSPTDIILRLQARRFIVKDTHCHRLRRQNSSSRKNYNISNDVFLETKKSNELTKLKSSFQRNNLKNNIDLKKCDNKRRIKQKKIVKTDDFCFLDQVNESNNELSVLENYDETNLSVEFNSILETTQINSEMTNHHKTIKVTNECEDVEYLKFKELVLIDSPKEALLRGRPYDSTESINDLQSLFTKMAITSYSNKEHDDSKVVDYISKKQANLQTKETLEKNIEVQKFVLKSLTHSPHDIKGIECLIIEPIKDKLTSREKYLMKKYSQIWKKYVVNKNNYFEAKRKSVLDKFINKLEKKKNSQNELSKSPNKAALLARDYKTYQHRYKVQKHIIAIQKAKLEEQNRMIDELKYNKIVEASKVSVDAMKEEVRKTYYEMDRQLKPKMKCLTNELKLHEIEEPALVLHCLKVPQFLQRMEKRAREREEKHAIIRERRQQMEEERIKLKQQAELAKLEMDKEEKILRIMELKEKRKRDKIETIRKKQYAEKMRALTVMADLHYEKNLKYRIGLQPLKNLLELRNSNIEKAKSHYKFQLMKNFFLHWMWYAEDQCYERNFIAESFYRKKLLGRVFQALNTNRHELVLKYQVADDYYDFYVVKLVFKKFRVGIAASQRENFMKMQKAIAYHNSNLKFKIFTCWRTLPALNALKREQEARKSRWREKVLQVVPDYAPPED